MIAWMVYNEVSLHSYCKYKKMKEAAQQARQKLAEKVKTVVEKITWKHMLIVAIPLAIYIYPRPILRLFMPIAAKINKNHPTVVCSGLVREIILTTNQTITLQSMPLIEITRGSKPNISQKQGESVQIQLFISERKNNPFSSQSVVLNQTSQSQVLLYSESLWTSFRLAKLQNPNLKVVLIKSSEQMLRNFLLRFYKLEKRESHKLGFFNENKLSILRLDERVGTYEQLTCEFLPIKDAERLK